MLLSFFWAVSITPCIDSIQLKPFTPNNCMLHFTKGTFRNKVIFFEDCVFSLYITPLHISYLTKSFTKIISILNDQGNSSKGWIRDKNPSTQSCKEQKLFNINREKTEEGEKKKEQERTSRFYSTLILFPGKNRQTTRATKGKGVSQEEIKKSLSERVVLDVTQHRKYNDRKALKRKGINNEGNRKQTFQIYYRDEIWAKQSAIGTAIKSNTTIVQFGSFTRSPYLIIRQRDKT